MAKIVSVQAVMAELKAVAPDWNEQRAVLRKYPVQFLQEMAEVISLEDASKFLRKPLTGVKKSYLDKLTCVLPETLPLKALKRNEKARLEWLTKRAETVTREYTHEWLEYLAGTETEITPTATATDPKKEEKTMTKLIALGRKSGDALQEGIKANAELIQACETREELTALLETASKETIYDSARKAVKDICGDGRLVIRMDRATKNTMVSSCVDAVMSARKAVQTRDWRYDQVVASYDTEIRNIRTTLYEIEDALGELFLGQDDRNVLERMREQFRRIVGILDERTEN